MMTALLYAIRGSNLPVRPTTPPYWPGIILPCRNFFHLPPNGYIILSSLQLELLSCITNQFYRHFCDRKSILPVQLAPLRPHSAPHPISAHARSTVSMSGFTHEHEPRSVHFTASGDWKTESKPYVRGAALNVSVLYAPVWASLLVFPTVHLIPR